MKNPVQTSVFCCLFALDVIFADWRHVPGDSELISADPTLNDDPSPATSDIVASISSQGLQPMTNEAPSSPQSLLNRQNTPKLPASYRILSPAQRTNSVPLRQLIRDDKQERNKPRAPQSLPSVANSNTLSAHSKEDFIHIMQTMQHQQQQYAQHAEEWEMREKTILNFFDTVSTKLDRIQQSLNELQSRENPNTLPLDLSEQQQQDFNDLQTVQPATSRLIAAPITAKPIRLFSRSAQTQPVQDTQSETSGNSAMDDLMAALSKHEQSPKHNPLDVMLSSKSNGNGIDVGSLLNAFGMSQTEDADVSDDTNQAIENGPALQKLVAALSKPTESNAKQSDKPQDLHSSDDGEQQEDNGESGDVDKTAVAAFLTGLGLPQGMVEQDAVQKKAEEASEKTATADPVAETTEAETVKSEESPNVDISGFSALGDLLS